MELFPWLWGGKLCQYLPERLDAHCRELPCRFGTGLIHPPSPLNSEAQYRTETLAFVASIDEDGKLSLRSGRFLFTVK